MNINIPGIDWGNLHFSINALTLSQTTYFSLFQTQRNCRQQFRIWQKWWIALWKSRKPCGKRRNCSLWAISPFPTMISKDLYCRHVLTRACLGRGWKKVITQTDMKFIVLTIDYLQWLLWWVAGLCNILEVSPIAPHNCKFVSMQLESSGKHCRSKLSKFRRV